MIPTEPQLQTQQREGAVWRGRASQHSAAAPHTSVINMFSDIMTDTVQVLTSWRQFRDRYPTALMTTGPVSSLSAVAGCTFGVKFCPMFCSIVAAAAL